MLEGSETRTGYAQSQANVDMVRDTVALSRDGPLEVDNRTGSISVTTWNRAAVGYEVRTVPPEGDTTVPFTTLETTKEEGKLELSPDVPWRLRIPGLVTIAPGRSERPPPTPPSRCREQSDSKSTRTVDRSNCRFLDELSLKTCSGGA